MKILTLACTLLAISLSAEASACEKWKSEIAGVGASIGSYVVSYKKHDGTFNDTANKAIAKLHEIKDRAESIQSCANDSDKFEKHRLTLLKVINFSLPIMAAGKYLAPSVKDELKD